MVFMNALTETSSKFINKLDKLGLAGPFSIKSCCRSYSALCLLRCLGRFDAMMCYINLQQMQVNKMGRYLPGSYLSPFFKRGVTIDSLLPVKVSGQYLTTAGISSVVWALFYCLMV